MLKKIPQQYHPDIRLGLRKKAIGFVILALTLFLPAGTLLFPAGWILVLLQLISFAFEIFISMPQNPELFALRSAIREESKQWDIYLTLFSVTFCYTAAMLLGSFDFRNQWTTGWPPVLIGLGIILWVIGSCITYWGMLTNQFFSSTVQIQTKRNHHVIDSGPYAIIRHPGYFGALLVYGATPLILSSKWVIIPALLSMIGFTVRTYLEDQTLQKELPGYQEYARRVKYRLIPGIF